MASNVMHSALRDGYSNRWNISYYAFENNYDIFQNSVVHLKFSGYISRQELILFCNDLQDYLNQYLNFTIDAAYTNDNNMILVIVKAIVVKNRRSRPPSARKRDAIRQERFITAKNRENAISSTQPFEPPVPELEERPCSDVTPNDSARAIQCARVDDVSQEVYPIQSSSGSSVYLHSDSDVMKRLKSFKFPQDSGVIMSSSRSCSSDSGTTSVLKIKKRVRRRHLVTSASIGSQTNVDVYDVSCQTTPVGEKKKKIFINSRAVQSEIDLVKWQAPTPKIFREFEKYLRSGESVQSKIPAVVAFMFCSGCNADHVERILKSFSQDVEVEVLISLLALSVNI